MSTLFLGINATPLLAERWAPALPTCTNTTDFVYAGCFIDPSSPSALLFRTNINSQNMTVEICVDFCKGNGYKYAGLEYYGECFCGDSVGGPETAETNCSFPCTGNKNESCGGNDILSVYQDTTFTTVDNTTISDYKPMGCYSDLSSSGRTLAWKQDQIPNANLTIEACLHACKDGGYAFAGVEYSQECYCGVVLGNGTAKVDESNCQMPCNGNTTELCGGAANLYLYVAEDLLSTDPCNGNPGDTLSSSSTTSYSSTSSSASSPASSTVLTTTSSTLSSTAAASTSYISPPPYSPPPYSPPPYTPPPYTPPPYSAPAPSSSCYSSAPASSSSSYPSAPASSSSTPISPPSSSSSSPSSSAAASSSSSAAASSSSTSAPSAPASSSSSIPSAPSSSIASSAAPSSSSSAAPSSSTSSSSPSSSTFSYSPPPSYSPPSSPSSSSSSSPSSSSSSSPSSSSSSSPSSSSSSSPSSSSSSAAPSSSTISSTISTSPPSSVPQPPASASSSSVSSAAPTSSTTPVSPPTTTFSSSPSTSSSAKPSTAPSPTTPQTSATLCTSTISIIPTPTCEYQVGNWCSTPLPPFANQDACLTAANTCAVQLTSCLLSAGFPGSLQCLEFSNWCAEILSYCLNNCPGSSCSNTGCKSQLPPAGYTPPVPSIKTSIYTCPTTIQTTSKPSPTTSTAPSLPTCSNICAQPNNPSQGYGSYSPVGNIPLPCYTCNNLQPEYSSGFPFKLYTAQTSEDSPGYSRPDCGTGCQDACDAQYTGCVGTYAQSCLYGVGEGGDTYAEALIKCQNQKEDCYGVNEGVSGGGRCESWNVGY
ncbi:hypothetical protein NHQ30_005191 [Ciborinia camelliae]|nr:hypothetical protein NHQ30_005191 [Ciborinia camelliae]